MAGAIRIILDGTLAMPDGPRAVRVEIIAAACVDGADSSAHAVAVSIEGMAPLRGCGDLAQ